MTIHGLKVRNIRRRNNFSSTSIQSNDTEMLFDTTEYCLDLASIKILTFCNDQIIYKVRVCEIST